MTLAKLFTASQLRRGGYRLVVQSQTGRVRSKPVTLSFSIDR